MMASAFGVSAAFLDGELSEFIAAGRLNCKINKVRYASRLLACVARRLTSACRWLACSRQTGRT